MKKFLAIVAINIILLFIIIFSVEAIVWGCENLRIKIAGEFFRGKLPVPFHPGIKRTDIVMLNDISKTWARKPEGINYKKKPIVIFGCSFAFGASLENKKIFSYKLSHFTKRPVYNVSYPGWGISHALYQVRQAEFFKSVPEPEYVIYIMIQDHFRRLYVPTFGSGTMLIEEHNLRYEDKNGELIIKQPKNKFFETFFRLYFVQKFEHFYINNVILRAENSGRYFGFALQHFIEFRKQMQKHWKNTKYVIILYNHFYSDEVFIEELKKNGFIVISPNYDYNLDLNGPEYWLAPDDTHPNEKAWDILTLKAAETLKL